MLFIHSCLDGLSGYFDFFFFLTFWPRKADITLPTKVRLVKAMVFPLVMYGCESWTVKKAEHRRIDAFIFFFIFIFFIDLKKYQHYSSKA